VLLNETNLWTREFDLRKYSYHILYPEYTIEFGESSFDSSPSMSFYTAPEMFSGILKIKYHTTVLYETNYWIMDGGRRYIPAPSISSIGPELWYLYYDLSTINGQLLRIFTNEKLDYSSREPWCIQFLLFNGEDHRSAFEQYYSENSDIISCEELHKNYKFQIETHIKVSNTVFSAIHIAKAFEIYKLWGEGYIPKAFIQR